MTHYKVSFRFTLSVWYVCKHKPRIKSDLNQEIKAGFDSCESFAHVALQFGHCSDKLRLWRLRELRIKAAGDAPPAVLSVFVLENRFTHAFTETVCDPNDGA